MRKLLSFVLVLSFSATAGEAARGGFKDGVTEHQKAEICVAAYRFLDANNERIKKKEVPAWEYWEARYVELVPDDVEREEAINTRLENYAQKKKRTPFILAGVYVSTCVEEHEKQTAG